MWGCGYVVDGVDGWMETKRREPPTQRAPRVVTGVACIDGGGLMPGKMT